MILLTRRCTLIFHKLVVAFGWVAILKVSSEMRVVMHRTLHLCVPLNFRSFNDFEKKIAQINFAQLKTLLLINRAYVVLL